MKNDRNFSNTDSSRIIGGIILVGAGALLLAKNMGVFFPYWLFTWPVIVILVGVYSAFKNNFHGNSWIFIIAAGCFFLLGQVRPGLELEPYFWPLFIIGAGLLFILRPKRNGTYKTPGKENYMLPDTTMDSTGAGSSGSFADGSDYFKINSIFSGVNRTVLSKNFKGASVSSVFGGSEIDFSQADITAPVIINTEIIFGGMKLIVPPHWTLVNEIQGIFHGVDDKRRYNTAPDIDPAKVLILKGSVIFGGVEIKSY